MTKLSMLNRGATWRELKLAAMYFSATYFGIAAFFKAAMPSDFVLATPPGVRLQLFLAHVALAALLYGFDRLIEHRFGTRTLGPYRASVLAVCLILAIRLYEYGWTIGHSNSDALSELRPIARGAIHLAAAGALMWLVFRFQRQVATGFTYLFAVAMILAIMAPGRLAADGMFDDYDTSVVRAHGDSQEPPVIVIVFDELSYQALLDEQGAIDPKRFPNFARLSAESLAFDNATTNYFFTSYVLPPMLDAAVALSSERDVTIYEGTARVERVFSAGCGNTYTCRGAGYMSLERARAITASSAVRGVEAMIPSEFHAAMRPALDRARGWTDSGALTADPLGIHVHSRQLADQFVRDLREGDSAGRVYLFHTLLPHAPFLFSPTGETSPQPQRYIPEDPPSTNEDADIYAHYLAQVEYADTILGKILRTLDETGIYDKASLLVTGDHGLRKTGTGTGHGDPAADSFMTRVPLFIRAPGIERGWTSIDYQHIDFGRTLFDLVDVDFVDVPQAGLAFEGVPAASALDTERPVRDKVFFMTENDERYWKFVYDQPSDSWTREAYVEAPAGDRTVAVNGD